MSRLQDSSSAGLVTLYPDLGTPLGVNPFGGSIYDVTKFINEPENTAFSFGLETDSDEAQLQLTSDPFIRSVSTNIEAFGALYTYVSDWLITHPQSGLNVILVHVTDMLCGKSRGDWVIEYENIAWCDDGQCKMNITLTEYTPKLNCMLSTFITDNHQGWFPPDGTMVFPVPQYIHPMFPYCDDMKPQFIQNFLFTIANGIALAIGSVAGILVVLASLVSSSAADAIEDQVNEVVEEWFNALLGCGRKHVAPFVRNYFQNVCDKCEVEFVSDIWNDPDSPYGRYYNTAHLSAIEVKGLPDDTTKNWIDRNKPNFLLPTYAYALKDIVNGKYRFEDGKFIFNHVTTFPDEIVFDFTGSDADFLLEPICYRGNKPQTYAGMKWNFSNDNHDYSGNEALHRYDGAKNWVTDANPNYGKRYKGVKQYNFPDFNVARFTTDGIDRKLAFERLDGQPFWPDDLLLMTADMANLGKLLIWDGDSPLNEAGVIRVDIYDYLEELGGFPQIAYWPDEYITDGGSPAPNTYFVFNFPLMFDSRDTKLNANLYDMYTSEDPSTGNIAVKDFTIVMDACCEVIDRVIYDATDGDGVQAKLGYKIQLNSLEQGEITYVNLDYEANTLTITGTVKYQ